MRPMRSRRPGEPSGVTWASSPGPEAGRGGWVKKKGSRPLDRWRVRADGWQLEWQYEKREDERERPRPQMNNFRVTNIRSLKDLL